MHMQTEEPTIRNLVLGMVQAVVSSPSMVRVEESISQESTLYEVYVDQNDIGYAIGKEGRVANAIRTVVKEAAKRNGVKAYVDVKGFAGDPAAADTQRVPLSSAS